MNRYYVCTPSLSEKSDKTAAEVCEIAGVGRRRFFAHIVAKRNEFDKIEWSAFSTSRGFACSPIRGHITGEYAEVCFVPNKSATTKKGEPYRYLAINETMKQPHLPGVLPFQTITFENTQYKLFGLVTNMDWEGETLSRWHHGRCGTSEEAHSIMKEDLAGGKLPSGDFGENAAWWWIMIFAHNLNTAMKNLILKGNWVTKRMEAIRFALITLP